MVESEENKKEDKQENKRQDEKKKREETNLIICVGNDRSYWHHVQQRFIDRYKGLKRSFEQFDLDEERASYPEMFLKIVEKNPKIIFIDFTSLGEQKIRLSQLLSRDNATKNIPLLGLVMKKDDVWKCFASGVKLIHVKGGEYHDVVYSAAYLASKRGANPHLFAKATIKDREENLIDDFRVGFITHEYVHMEGNLRMESGQEIIFDIEIPNKILPSKKLIVRNASSENLYYDFKYAYDFNFVYVDEPSIKEIDLEEKTLLEKATSAEEKKDVKTKMTRKRDNIEVNYLNLLKSTKKRLKKWVLENTMYSRVEKKTKILVVDRDLKILKESKQYIDHYPFSIRTQTYLDDDLEILSSYRPHLIMFQHTSINIQQMRDSDEYADEEDIIDVLCKEFRSANNNIQRCMDNVESLENYDPMIIIFHCLDLSKEFDFLKYPELKDCVPEFNYTLHMIREEQIDINGLLEMGKLYEKKQRERHENKLKEKINALKAKDSAKYGRLRVNDFEEQRYYVASSNPLSHAATSYRVKFLSLTESEVEIGSQRELEMSTYRLNCPVPMSISLVPVQEENYREEGGLKIYKGLIHSINELDKVEIRRQVNEVFCAPIVEQRKKEFHAFLELNERKSGELKASREAQDVSTTGTDDDA